MRPVKIAFLGQKAIAAACLDMLLTPRNRERLDLVVLGSDPDFHERFRDQLVASLVFLPNHERGADSLLKAMVDTGAELILSVQHPWVLPAAVLDAAPKGAFNLHNARLPDYRGHGSISHAILQGDTTYATTIHWMAPEVDRGHIVCEREVVVADQETAFSLYAKTLTASVENFARFLELLLAPQGPPRIPMRDGGHFYGKDSLIPLKQIHNLGDPVEFDRKSRAFYFPPHEPAYVLLDGNKHYVVPAWGQEG